MVFPRSTSVAAYRAAFIAVRPKMTPMQWKMLEAQFLAPDHMATAGELATAAGSDTYRTTNIAYSALGRKLRHVLRRPVRKGHTLVGIFSEFMVPDKRNPNWRFVMRRPAVLALQSLGWFDEDGNVTANSVAHDKTRAAAEEGRIQKRLSIHRSRERSLRAAKLAATIAQSSDGRLRCEVPECGFDFEAVYGELGAGFAEVHHLRPLAQMDGPVETTLDDLAVVCANCHRMIHLGGECRKMTGLVR